ncbi:ubiquitin family protein [Senna tora]|uniref:Ubiquitin family protein n=1 Tax=Senna tora TaxID=362788 RepID=A0A834TB55_9FABA|nr:ubiquitin family protein [Senna tora]
MRIAGGEIVPEIEMVAWGSILDLKMEIEKELGVEVERQRLWYETREVRNDEMIGAYRFREGDTLNLTVRPLEEGRKLHILVKQIGANGYVRMREIDKVSDLRNKVEKYWGIPQSLFTLRRFNTQMQDHLPLFAYYITEDTEIHLCLNLQPR